MTIFRVSTALFLMLIGVTGALCTPAQAALPDDESYEFVTSRYNVLLEQRRNGCAYYANPRTLVSQGNDRRLSVLLIQNNGSLCNGTFEFQVLSVRCQSREVSYSVRIGSPANWVENWQQIPAVADPVCSMPVPTAEAVLINPPAVRSPAVLPASPTSVSAAPANVPANTAPATSATSTERSGCASTIPAVDPWQLQEPVLLGDAESAGYYNRVILAGDTNSVAAFLDCYDLTVKYQPEYASAQPIWGACADLVRGQQSQTVCVAVDETGNAADDRIYSADYATEVVRSIFSSN